MKRFLWVLLLGVLMCATEVKAQDVDTRPMWGAKASLDVNIPGKWHVPGSDAVSMYRTGLGFNVGAVYNVWLGKGFFLEPGVSLFYDTYSFKDLIIGDGVSTDPSLYKLGVRIPVVVGYGFDITDKFSMSVFTGPEFSYAFAGDIRQKDEAIWGEDPWHLFGEYGNQRRPEFAWKIGLGFPQGAWQFNIEAAIGISDVAKNNISQRDNRVSLAITRYF